MAKRLKTPNGRCAVCSHPDRARLEWLAASGASLHSIAKQFGVHYHSMWRHDRFHVSDHRKATLLCGPLKLSELCNEAAETGRSVLDHFRVLRSIAYDGVVACHEAGDRSGTATMLGRAAEINRDVGRITGELISIGSVHLEQNNYYSAFQKKERLLTEGLLSIARECPDARPQIINLLRSLDQDDGDAATPAQATPLPPMIEGRAVTVINEHADQ